MSSLINRLVSPFAARKFSSLSDSTLNHLTLGFTDTFHQKSKFSLLMFTIAIAAIMTVNYEVITGPARLWMVLQLSAFTLLLAWVFLLQGLFRSANLRLFFVLIFQFANGLFLSWGACFLGREPSVLFYNSGVLAFVAIIFAFLNRDNYKLYGAFLLSLLIPTWFALVQQGSGPWTIVAINLVALVLFKVNHSLFMSEKELFLLELAGRGVDRAAGPAAKLAPAPAKTVEPSRAEAVQQVETPDLSTPGLLERLMPLKTSLSYKTFRVFASPASNDQVFYQYYQAHDHLYLVVIKAQMPPHETAILYAHIAGYLQSIFLRIQTAPVVARLAQHLQGYMRKKNIFENINAIIMRLDHEGINYVVAGEVGAFCYQSTDRVIKKLERSARSLSSVLDITLGKRRVMRQGDRVLIALDENMGEREMQKLFQMNELEVKALLEQGRDDFLLLVAQTQWGS